MTETAPGTVGVTSADGVLDDVAELTSPTAESDQAGKDPFIGELMGPGLHPELANCRRVRVRFDIPTHRAKPRFRLIHRNEPTDGAPAECHWLTVAPRAGLRAHRSARQRSEGRG